LQPDFPLHQPVAGHRQGETAKRQQTEATPHFLPASVFDEEQGQTEEDEQSPKQPHQAI
jgi:hypothetical protein